MLQTTKVQSKEIDLGLSTHPPPFLPHRYLSHPLVAPRPSIHRHAPLHGLQAIVCIQFGLRPVDPRSQPPFRSLHSLPLIRFPASSSSMIA